MGQFQAFSVEGSRLLQVARGELCKYVKEIITLIIIGKKTVTAIGSVSGPGHESVS